MFHVRNGLYFQRQDNGDVRILKTDADGGTILDQTMDVDSFASVVASMSKGGEADGRFYKAREFLTE